nr:acyl-CoA dehydrogenase family protein [Rhodococcus wratislaviensis]GLK36440.1 acyl-CoA dehydrogenase [Rhodococcus wratislaviensis]
MTDTSQELVELITDLASDATLPVAGDLPGLWPKLIELGLTTVGVPEEAGGSGGTLVDLVVLVRTLALQGVSTPLAEAALANQILGESGGEIARSTIAVLDHTSGSDAITLSAVPWARHCERLVTVDEDRVGVIDLTAPGVAITPRTNLCGDARDDVSVPADAWQKLSGAPTAADVLGRLALLGSAALTGAIEGTYGLARLQVQTREQFGQPLIEIPAVAGNLAELKVALLESGAALDRAVESVTLEATGRTTVDPTAVTAWIMASRAGTRAARIGHQLHGALGITREYPLHHYTTRIWAWRDEPISESRWLACLGELALSQGEHALWETLTA